MLPAIQVLITEFFKGDVGNVPVGAGIEFTLFFRLELLGGNFLGKATAVVAFMPLSCCD